MRSLVDVGVVLPLRPCTGKYGQALFLISSFRKEEWFNVRVNMFRGIQDNRIALLGESTRPIHCVSRSLYRRVALVISVSTRRTPEGFISDLPALTLDVNDRLPSIRPMVPVGWMSWG